MPVGIRTQDLRKIYNSAPPLGAAGGFIARADAKGGKQPKVQIPALDGLSLEVLPGEIFGLLGPNGAGKSTTIGVLTTRVRPTSGQAWIGEYDVTRRAIVCRLMGGWFLVAVASMFPVKDPEPVARADLASPVRAGEVMSEGFLAIGRSTCRGRRVRPV